jgi:hypothetical protein
MSMNLAIYCPVTKSFYQGLYQTPTDTTYKLLGPCQLPSRTHAAVLEDYESWLRSKDVEDVERIILDIEHWMERYPDAYFCAT